MITFKNISKVFNKNKDNQFTLFHDLDLTVNEGDFISLLGANGSGKSTLLNILCGTETIDEGTLYIGTESVGTHPSFKRFKRISRVYQDPTVGTAPHLTVYENLALALNKGKLFNLRPLGKSDEALILKELKKLNMGLEHKVDVPVKELSGGQRQALSLLMALINEPDILLLDEHTAALDPSSSKYIMKLTYEMVKERNLTTIMVTHNLEDAKTYANRIIVLDKQKIAVDLCNHEVKEIKKEDLEKMV